MDQEPTFDGRTARHRETVLRILPEVEAAAERNIARLQLKLDARMQEMNGWMRMAQQPHVTGEQVVLRLWQVANIVTEAAIGIAPCTKGCNHCCHMPVAVIPSEAKLIGKRIGIKPAKVQVDMEMADDVFGKDYSRPCTFLTPEGCGIYEHRPFSCRVYVHLDDSPRLCDLGIGFDAALPSMNVNNVKAVYARQALKEGGYGELRRWFPAWSKK